MSQRIRSFVPNYDNFGIRLHNIADRLSNIAVVLIHARLCLPARILSEIHLLHLKTKVFNALEIF